MATSSRSSSKLSLYSKLPPIGLTNDEPYVSVQDVQKGFSDARDESYCLLQQLADQTVLIRQRIEDRLKGSLERTVRFINESETSKERMHGSEVEALKRDISDVTAARDASLKREQALVDQQTKMSIELAAERKARKQAEERATNLVAEHRVEVERMQSSWNGDVTSQRAKIEAEIKHVGTLKEQIATHSAEIQRLRADLKKERMNREQLEDSKNADETKLSTSNKKLALEISKLKAHIQTTTDSLTSVSQQKSSLEKKLEQMQRNHADAVKLSTSSNANAVKVLKEKVSSLESEMTEMRIKYQREIDRLLAQLHEAQNASVDTDLLLEDARIRQLRKLNQEEKKLLEKEKKHTRFQKAVKLEYS